ncbi:MAG: hypothetical protein BWY42_01307 [Candidatus Omnitrophica bacterium ADurb.Bin277]|nr:MAG: hypothetical protein BWY42_01307 [Candidatus Omnitrophica bacterium ADurb.Bin277]
MRAIKVLTVVFFLAALPGCAVSRCKGEQGPGCAGKYSASPAVPVSSCGPCSQSSKAVGAPAGEESIKSSQYVK